MRRAGIALTTLVTLALSACSGSTVSAPAEADGGALLPDASFDDQTPPYDGVTGDSIVEQDAADTLEPDGPQELRLALEAIPGMVVTEDAWYDNYRVLRLQFEQPVDHDVPDGQTYAQRLTLLHTSSDAPMVLFSTGYFLYGDDSPSEIAALAGANQIAVEHRYFDVSVPDGPPWDKLTIRQAAADHHRIVQALRPLYPARWLGTGHSKGGMTSVYHRRFFPDDLDGTVAYVAPLSLAAGDERYVAFLEQVGPAECRQRLLALQRRMLERKTALLPWMGSLGSFDLLGAEKAFEHSVVEMPFMFWQYSGAGACSIVPTLAASDAELWDFLWQYSGLTYTTDDSVLAFRPYFFQAGTELGYPTYDESSYADLETYPGTDVPASYGPPGVPMPYDPSAMADVDQWVTTQGQGLMFLYGQVDPWTAGAFRLGDAQDSYLYEVPDGTHSSLLSDLPEPARSQAFETVSRWLNAPLAITSLDAPTIEALRARVVRFRR